MNEDGLLEIADVAEWLGVSRWWVYDHISRVEPIIPHIRAGRKIRFRAADVREFIAARREERPVWERVKTA